MLPSLYGLRREKMMGSEYVGVCVCGELETITAPRPAYLYILDRDPRRSHHTGSTSLGASVCVCVCLYAWGGAVWGVLGAYLLVWGVCVCRRVL